METMQNLLLARCKPRGSQNEPSSASGDAGLEDHEILLGVRCVVTYAVFLHFQTTNPARPVPRRIMVLGSGMGWVPEESGPENLEITVVAAPANPSTELARNPKTFPTPTIIDSDPLWLTPSRLSVN